MIYGYARCSTNEKKQDIDRQRRDLLAAGVPKRDNIRIEWEHGDTPDKAVLSNLLNNEVKEGDTIITLEVSRLSRSTKQLCEIIETIKHKKLKLVIVNGITLDCSKGEIEAMAEAYLEMAGVFAKLELNMIRARIKSGMANAKAKGAKIGRPKLTEDKVPSIFFRHYPSYKVGKLNVAELARVCALSRTTIYKYIRVVSGHE